MITQAKKDNKLQLEVRFVDGKPEVHFCYEGEKYIAIHLEGDCEEFFIKDDPLPESLCSWALLEVVRDTRKEARSLRVSLLGNGFIPQDRATLEQVVQEANIAIHRRQNTILDITNELYSLGWNIYLSDEPTPNRNPNL